MTERPIADRITFLPDDQVMEVDLSEMTLETSSPVHALYDELDRRVGATGQKWYFLVNYRDCTVMTMAWIAFAHRGKLANLAYSLGTARYAAAPDVAQAVEERSTLERFDPSLFTSREAALDHLRSLRAAIPTPTFQDVVTLPQSPPPLTYDQRILFDPDLSVMEVDLSDIVFDRSETVNAFYDAVEQRLQPTDRRWYFLVNYKNCEILPNAWSTFAARGKRLNAAHSLGSVRYDVGTATSRSIAEDSNRESFDPNIFVSRDQALAHIVGLQTKISPATA